jgi:hypothetical protein
LSGAAGCDWLSFKEHLSGKGHNTMSAPGPILIELILILGGVIAFGLWELYSLRRDKKRAEAEAKRVPPDERE